MMVIKIFLDSQQPTHGCCDAAEDHDDELVRHHADDHRSLDLKFRAKDLLMIAIILRLLCRSP